MIEKIGHYQWPKKLVTDSVTESVAELVTESVTESVTDSVTEIGHRIGHRLLLYITGINEETLTRLQCSGK